MESMFNLGQISPSLPSPLDARLQLQHDRRPVAVQLLRPADRSVPMQALRVGSEVRVVCRGLLQHPLGLPRGLRAVQLRRRRCYWYCVQPGTYGLQTAGGACGHFAFRHAIVPTLILPPPYFRKPDNADAARALRDADVTGPSRTTTSPLSGTIGSVGNSFYGYHQF